MALEIESLLPDNQPIYVLKNADIDFTCIFYETGDVAAGTPVGSGNGKEVVAVQWQRSLDVNTNYQNAPFASTDFTQTDAGSAYPLDYTSTYNTGNLTASNDVYFYRIAITIADIGTGPTDPSAETFFSSEYLIANGFDIDIGDREINLIIDPEIQIFASGYLSEYILADNASVSLVASGTLSNTPIEDPTTLADFDIFWEYTFDDPDDPGTVWTTLSDGSDPNFPGSGMTWTTTQELYIFQTVPDTDYAVRSTLQIDNISGDLNGAYIRPYFVETTYAINSPLRPLDYSLFVINPEISILQQPGENAQDTQSPAYSYSAGNPANTPFGSTNGGDLRVSVSAVTNSVVDPTLSYQWQFKRYNDGISGDLNEDLNNISGWLDVTNTEEFNILENTSVLRLSNVEYADRYLFRVIISGNTSEPDVISDIHEIYFQDSVPSFDPLETTISGTTSPVEQLEDYYGPVANRDLLTDKPLRTVTFLSSLDTSFTGIEGNLELQWQRLDPGEVDIEANWDSVGSPILYDWDFFEDFAADSFETVPLKIADDDGARYRIRGYSSAYYTFDDLQPYPDKKTLIPFYSNSIQIGLTKEIFIVSQPASVQLFNGQSASFSISADSTSDPSELEFQWQYTTKSGVNPDLTNIQTLSNGSLSGDSFNDVIGATTSDLIVSNVNSDVENYFFRVIVSDDEAIATKISNWVKADVTQDIFTYISSIGNKTAVELTNVNWTVEANSLSGDVVLYEWQYTEDIFNPDWQTVSFTNAVGVTTDSLDLTSVTQQNVGYYRLQVTSAGGVVDFTNTARLKIQLVGITITEDLPLNTVIVENENPPPFSVTAFSTNGEDISYQWQYNKNDGNGWVDFGLGLNNQLSNNNPYTPFPLNKDNSWDGTQVRVRMSIPAFNSQNTGIYVFSNISTIDLRRQITYFADSAVRLVEDGASLAISLNPSLTAAFVPTYAWEYSSNGGTSYQSVSGLGLADGFTTLIITSVDNSYDGYIFRCLITANLLDDLVYTRSGVGFVDDVSIDGFGYTATIEISVTGQPIIPTYYTKQVTRTGAAIGTVICVPKPDDYIDDNETAVNDDYTRWAISNTGSEYVLGNTTSFAVFNQDFSQSPLSSTEIAARQAEYNQIQQSNLDYIQRRGSWIDDEANYKSPKWSIKDDRFPGFIEMRGQWLEVDDFPLLYAIIGDTYGALKSGPNTVKFKLPNTYGKKMMGTGPVDARRGSDAVVPLFQADGQSGGDVDVPGTIGGVYNYSKSRQLPPGSPGIAGETDGTAGTIDPEVSSLGSYRTDGWEELEAVLDTNFQGSFSYSVGPILQQFIPSPPEHSHTATAIRYRDNIEAASSCTYLDDFGPYFGTGTESSGEIQIGPEGISAADRGRQHTHGISPDTYEVGNDPSLNHSDGIGDVPGEATSFTETVKYEFDPLAGPGSPSLNVFLPQADITMTTTSRTIFDSSLSFYIRNTETVPIQSKYFRMKWMIKAY